MNKKLMAVAVAGALAVPGMALAQSSTVQIGGSLTTFYYKHSPKNDSVGQSTDILETSEPELYVRGEEKLGGGLSVWFQCTSSMDAMIGGSAAAQGWCGRNSGVGFKGNFGNVFQGNWDQPQKLVYNQARGWWGSTNSLTGGTGRTMMGGGPSGVGNPTQSVASPSTTTTPLVAGASTTVTTVGTGTAMSNTPSGFARRQANSWNYHSPEWNGFTFQGSFSAANEQTGLPNTSSLSPRMYSIGGHYRNGPLYLGLAYEKHSDYNPGNATVGGLASQYSGGTDTNWTVVAGYTFGTFNVRGMYVKNDYDVTNSSDLDVNGWALFADWAVSGPHTLRAQYSSMGDTGGSSATNVGVYKGATGAGCGTTSAISCGTDTGAKVWGVAYSYAFSKRTEGSVVYTKLSNDSNAAMSLGKVNASAGNNQTSTGIVLKHRF